MTRPPRIIRNGPHDTAWAVLALVAGVAAFVYILH